MAFNVLKENIVDYLTKLISPGGKLITHGVKKGTCAIDDLEMPECSISADNDKYSRKLKKFEINSRNMKIECPTSKKI